MNMTSPKIANQRASLPKHALINSISGGGGLLAHKLKQRHQQQSAGVIIQNEKVSLIKKHKHTSK